MYTAQQIRDRLSIAKLDTIYHLIRSGQLAATNIAVDPRSRPCWRISQEALDDFLAARQARPPAKTSRRRRRKLAAVTQYF